MKKRCHPVRAVTLIELMITLAIIAIVLSVALVTMSGYLPKQRLITSQGLLADLLQRAQTEANARSYWTCVRFSTPTSETSPISAQVRVDITNAHGTANACAAGTGLAPLTLKSDIAFGSGTNCANNITKDCVIWFDTTGSPKLCPSDYSGCGSLATAAAPPSCIDWNYQIILSNSKLGTGTRSRKVEALSGGLIQVVKPSETGLITTLVTKTANPSSGCE